MALYWIGYDLDKPGQDYKDLIKELETLGAVRILKSDWLLGHIQTTPTLLRDYLRKFIDKNDRVMVSELKNSAAWYNLLVSDQTIKDLFTRFAS